MKFAYARVSTKNQNEDRQLNNLLNYVEYDNIFIDYYTGKTFNRAEWNKLFDKVRENDEVFFHELDRIGRNKNEMIKNIRLLMDKGVIIRILNIPTTMMNLDKFDKLSKDIIVMINNVLIEVLSTIAETEYDFNKKRQAEGIAIAKSKGKYKGRKPLKQPANFEKLYKLWKKEEITKKQFYELCKFKTYNTLNKHIKAYEKKTNN